MWYFPSFFIRMCVCVTIAITHGPIFAYHLSFNYCSRSLFQYNLQHFLILVFWRLTVFFSFFPNLFVLSNDCKNQQRIIHVFPMPIRCSSVNRMRFEEQIKKLAATLNCQFFFYLCALIGRRLFYHAV